MVRIQRRLQSRTDVRCLLLSRVQLDDEMLDEVVPGRDLRRRLLHVRQTVFPILRRTAETFGVMAGVCCLQAAPLRLGRRPDVFWRHAYHAALLGFVEASGARTLDQALAGTPTAPLIEIGRFAARQMLTFEPPEFPAVRRLVTGWRERWSEPNEPLRRYGLVVRPTWNVSPTQLWLDYLVDSAGIPTFTSFGQLALDGPDDDAHPEPTHVEIPVDTQGANPTNIGRHLEAVARKNALAEAAAPVYRRLEREHGAAPSRRRLLQELRANNIDVHDGRLFRETLAGLRQPSS